MKATKKTIKTKATTIDFKNSVIVDYDYVEGNLDAYYIPKGYNIIEVYYGGGELFRKNRTEFQPSDADDYVDAVKELTDIGYLTGKCHQKSILEWKKEYPDIQINPETDIVIVGNTEFGRQTAVIYVPDNIKHTVWTNLHLAKCGNVKVAAAKYLSKHINKMHKRG